MADFKSMLKNRASFAINGKKYTKFISGSSTQLMKSLPKNKVYKTKLAKHVEEIPASPTHCAKNMFEVQKSSFRYYRRLSDDVVHNKNEMCTTVRKNKLNKLNILKENSHEYSMKKLKRNRTLLIKNTKGNDSSNEATPKIKAIDLFSDMVKKGNSQGAKGDSTVSNKSNKPKNNRNLLKDPKFQQNVYFGKGPRNSKGPKDDKRCFFADSKEVNRIFNVLQNNLLSPQGGKIGLKSTIPTQDPKRSQVRQLLQKHFYLKEQELQQSKNLRNN